MIAVPCGLVRVECRAGKIGGAESPLSVSVPNLPLTAQTTLQSLRPEYLKAVAAARWNLWLIPFFLSAPLLLLVPLLWRWHRAVI
jgi:hypothetical protein